MQSSRVDMLQLSFFCTSLNDLLIEFLDGCEKSELSENLQKALTLFEACEWSHPQRTVFEDHLENHKDLGEKILALLNRGVAKAERERAAKEVLYFFSGLAGKCLWHHTMNTYFYPPLGLLRLGRAQ